VLGDVSPELALRLVGSFLKDLGDASELLHVPSKQRLDALA
jgi:hypothetical protein